MKKYNENNIDKIGEAMSNIDDDLLDSALLTRRKLQQNQPVKDPARTARRIALLAACLTVATTVTVLAVTAAPADKSEASETSETAPETTKVLHELAEVIKTRYTLEELYEMEPYNYYLPRSGLENLEVENCYHRDLAAFLLDDVLIDAGDDMFMEFVTYNPELEYRYLEHLRIIIDKQAIYKENSSYVNSGIFDVNFSYIPYDPTDVESYERAHHELSYYSSKEVSEERKHKVFLPQDVSLEVIQNLYHDTTQFESESNIGTYSVEKYRYSFEIDILFDNDYTITYRYYGSDITPEMMYEMIMSADCFAS